MSRDSEQRMLTTRTGLGVRGAERGLDRLEQREE